MYPIKDDKEQLQDGRCHLNVQLLSVGYRTSKGIHQGSIFGGV
jgi:hypothetical protein